LDSYLIGAIAIEFLFWLSLDHRSYGDLAPVRAIIYGLALLLFYPVAQRFARERNKQRREVPLPDGTVTPADSLAVHLPENITVFYRAAPLSRRLWALTIDMLFVGAIAGIWWFGMAVAHDVLRARSLATLGLELGLMLLPIGYFIYMEATCDGQTLGKRQAGIRAIHESGRALNFGEVFARNMLRPLMLLPPFNLIEAICLRSNAWRQRLGDLAASSVVIVDPR
jgi:uncharacterized RDD family membrane protein YckC